MKYIFNLLLIVSMTGYSQGYVSIGGTNAGIQVGVGILANNLDIQLKYQLPLISLEIPKILSFNVGYRILLSSNEIDNFSITPSVGYAYLRSKDFSLYNTSPTLDKILVIEEFKPMYNVEIGKDWHMGRLSFTYTYCNRSCYGLTIKCFFTQLN